MWRHNSVSKGLLSTTNRKIYIIKEKDVLCQGVKHIEFLGKELVPLINEIRELAIEFSSFRVGFRDNFVYVFKRNLSSFFKLEKLEIQTEEMNIKK